MREVADAGHDARGLNEAGGLRGQLHQVQALIVACAAMFRALQRGEGMLSHLQTQSMPIPRSAAGRALAGSSPCGHSAALRTCSSRTGPQSRSTVAPTLHSRHVTAFRLQPHVKQPLLACNNHRLLVQHVQIAHMLSARMLWSPACPQSRYALYTYLCE